MLNIFKHQTLEYSHEKYVPTSFNVNVSSEVFPSASHSTERVYKLNVVLQATVTFGSFDTMGNVIDRAQQHIVRQMYGDSHAIIYDIMYELQNGNVEVAKESVNRLMKIVGVKYE